jgi:hypothetical protein
LDLGSPGHQSIAGPEPRLSFLRLFLSCIICLASATSSFLRRPGSVV